MIIGPLEKQHVARLHSETALPVPTLALNNVEGSSSYSNLLYQFALSPENEAVQIAERAWQDGHRYAAILSPAPSLMIFINASAIALSITGLVSEARLLPRKPIVKTTLVLWKPCLTLTKVKQERMSWQG